MENQGTNTLKPEEQKVIPSHDQNIHNQLTTINKKTTIALENLHEFAKDALNRVLIGFQDIETTIGKKIEEESQKIEFSINSQIADLKKNTENHAQQKTDNLSKSAIIPPTHNISSPKPLTPQKTSNNDQGTQTDDFPLLISDLPQTFLQRENILQMLRNIANSPKNVNVEELEEANWIMDVIEYLKEKQEQAKQYMGIMSEITKHLRGQPGGRPAITASSAQESESLMNSLDQLQQFDYSNNQMDSESEKSSKPSSPQTFKKREKVIKKRKKEKVFSSPPAPMMSVSHVNNTNNDAYDLERQIIEDATGTATGTETLTTEQETSEKDISSEKEEISQLGTPEKESNLLLEQQNAEREDKSKIITNEQKQQERKSIFEAEEIIDADTPSIVEKTQQQEVSEQELVEHAQNTAPTEEEQQNTVPTEEEPQDIAPQEEEQQNIAPEEQEQQHEQTEDETDEESEADTEEIETEAHQPEQNTSPISNSLSTTKFNEKLREIIIPILDFSVLNESTTSAVSKFNNSTNFANSSQSLMQNSHNTLPHSSVPNAHTQNNQKDQLVLNDAIMKQISKLCAVSTQESAPKDELDSLFLEKGVFGKVGERLKKSLARNLTPKEQDDEIDKIMKKIIKFCKKISIPIEFQKKKPCSYMICSSKHGEQKIFNLKIVSGVLSARAGQGFQTLDQIITTILKKI